MSAKWPRELKLEMVAAFTKRTRVTNRNTWEYKEWLFVADPKGREINKRALGVADFAYVELAINCYLFFFCSNFA